MAGHDQPRTRMRETVSPHDPHPDLTPENFAEIVDGDRERATVGAAAELSEYAEIMKDQVLIEMARAQTTSLREAVETAEPSMVGKSDEEIVDYFHDLQLSDPSQALVIMNDSVRRAATILDQNGITSTSLASAISRAANSLGGNIAGIPSDLSQMGTSGILTVAGMGFGSFILSGRPGVGFAMGGLGLAMQSSHLTDMTINLGSAAVRGATQFAALPIRGAMRTTDIINNLGRDGLMDSIQGNAVGMGNDVINSIAYTFDGESTPENGLDNNLLLRELYEQGEIFAPDELQPFVLYLKELRNGGPISRLPTQAECQTAGAFIRQVSSLVTADEFTAIQERRIAGEDLSSEENRKYILYKYCMIVNDNFIGEGGMLPYADIVTDAYVEEYGAITLEQAFASLSPTELAALDSADFSWTEEQRAAFDNNIEGLEINFENITKGGFVGTALTAYLALTYAFMMIRGVRGIYKAGSEKAKRIARNRSLPASDRTLSNSQRTRLTRSLNDGQKKVGGVVSALSGASILTSDSNFRAVSNVRLEDLDQTKLAALQTEAENESATRGSIREKFFDLMDNESVLDETQQEAMSERRDFYTFREALNRIDNFYKFDARGTARPITLNGQTYTIGRPERGDFRFTTVTQLAQNANPRNFYRYITNNGDGRTLRMKAPGGNEIQLKIRRNSSGVYQFHAHDAEGWQNFDLNEFATSIPRTSGTTETPEATP